MKRLLVLEDEATIREFEVLNLTRAGYDVMETGNGDEALAIYDREGGRFDIAILDIMTEGTDGLTVCKELRKRSNSLGIILLTAKTQEFDKVNGLTQGADDYVTKPFSPSELVARVDALHRRVAMQHHPETPSETKVLEVLRSGRFALNTRKRILYKDDKPMDLTQVEFQIVEFFLSHPGVPLSRAQILHHIWGEQFFGEEKIVDVNIRRLRVKIEEDPSNPQYILTAWKQGYEWNIAPRRRDGKE